MTQLVKMKRADGAEAIVEAPDVETWRGYGFKPADPLDHDGDGDAGGSVKGYHSTAAKGARKRKRKGS